MILSQRALTRLLGIAALAAIAGCRDAVAPIATKQATTRYTPMILDGAHNNGDRSVFFLPPMVSNPGGQAGFGDPVQSGLPVSFRILRLFRTDISSCGSSNQLIKTFQASTVQFLTDHYQANWHTDESNLQAECTYRIEVRIGPQLMAFADVDVVSSGKELKKVDSDEFIPLLDDRTLPIKVRVERGVEFCTNEHCVSEVVTNTPPAGRQYTQVTTSDGEDVAFFPEDWFDPRVAGTNQVIVTASDVTEELSSLPGGCSLGLTAMLSREHCVRFTTEPEVTIAEGKTVIVGTCVEGPGDPRQLLLKYDVGEPPVFLRNVPLPSGFVCPEDQIGSTVRSSNPLVNLASAAFSRLGRGVNWLMGTKTAYAIDLGVGGGIDAGDGFSVIGFGLAASMSKVAGDNQTGSTGGVLPIAPQVRLIAAHRPGESSSIVRGATVTCTVTGGGGALVVGEGTAPSGPATENESGTYTCPSWRLGAVPGQNTLKVSAARLDDNVVVAVIGEGGPERITLPGSATFTATGVENPPDLTIANVNLSPASQFPQGRLNLSFEVHNGGGDMAAGTTSTVVVAFSSDQTLSADDFRFSPLTVPTIPNGSGASYTLFPAVPTGRPFGSQFILIVADPGATLPEANDGNNLSSVAVSVLAPQGGNDLVMLGDANIFDNTAGAGQFNQQLYRNLVSYTTDASRGGATHVLMHCGHGAPSCAPGTTFGSTLAAIGYTVDRSDALATPIASNVKVVMLVTPTAGFSSGEVGALQAFANSGGRIVLLSDGDVADRVGMLAATNSVLVQLGLPAQPTSPTFGCPGPALARSGGIISQHQIAAGVLQVSFACALEVLSLGEGSRNLFFHIDLDVAHLLGAVVPVPFPIG